MSVHFRECVACLFTRDFSSWRRAGWERQEEVSRVSTRRTGQLDPEGGRTSKAERTVWCGLIQPFREEWVIQTVHFSEHSQGVDWKESLRSNFHFFRELPWKSTKTTKPNQTKNSTSTKNQLLWTTSLTRKQEHVQHRKCLLPLQLMNWLAADRWRNPWGMGDRQVIRLSGVSLKFWFVVLTWSLVSVACKQKKVECLFSKESIHLQDKELMQIKLYYLMIGSKMIKIKSYPLLNLLVWIFLLLLLTGSYVFFFFFLLPTRFTKEFPCKKWIWKKFYGSCSIYVFLSDLISSFWKEKLVIFFVIAAPANSALTFRINLSSLTLKWERGSWHASLAVFLVYI